MKVDPNRPVLIVDDYTTMVRIMKKLLQQIGYFNVDAASNAEEALEKIRSTKYSLIISDWHLQPMSGYALLERIRAEEATTEPTPFLFVTTESIRDRLHAAHDIAVSAYLEKPLNADMLKQKIESLFSMVNSELAYQSAGTIDRRARMLS